MGSLLGRHDTVIRGGFGVYYDRLNGEDTVVAPGLTAGISSSSVTAPQPCSYAGVGGAGCNTASTNPAAADYRVGVDGAIPVPTAPATIPSPYVPASPFGEAISFGLDPDITPPRSYTADFSIQRQLANGLVLEIGYVGHFGEGLIDNLSLNSSPYMFVDTASGQTFAQAYNSVANQLRSGTTAANVVAQPFFTDQMSFLGTDPTATLATDFASDFTGGLVSSLFNSMDSLRLANGLQAYDNEQVELLNTEVNFADSNYNSLVATLRETATNRLDLDLSYTWSNALDTYAEVANDSGNMPTAFSSAINYGPSVFDRKQTLVGTAVYALPWRANGGWNRLVGDWRVSGIFSAYSGLPLQFVESSQALGGGIINMQNVGMIPNVSTSSFGAGVHSGIAGSGSVGVSGSPAEKGTGLNMFADPQQVFDSFSPIQLGVNTVTGRANPIFGLPFWNLDASLAKTMNFTERVNGTLRFDFYNLFNNVNFANPSMSYSSPGSFGVISSQFIPSNRISGSRWIEIGLQVDF